ncbi:MAG: type I-D CRISPR-associated protein Cas5/Csc1 [Spirulina sp.]
MLYQCDLTLHDNVFFATREMGTLFETEKYLHNWALSYALFEGQYLNRPYRLQGAHAQKPSYLDSGHEQSLHPLNEAGIYVFPARPLQWSYQVNTFKAAQVHYYGKSKQFGDKGADRNYPINFGRAKELAVGSTYRTYIAATDRSVLPTWMRQQDDDKRQTWIRLGKWAAKIHIRATPVTGLEERKGKFICRHPLNPLDLLPSTVLLIYNRIVMPPVSLVSQAQLEGDYWRLPDDTDLPIGSYYGARYVANAS